MSPKKEASKPLEESNSSEIERFDILIVSQNRSLRVIDRGLVALINMLQTNHIVRAQDEAIAEEWTEVYCQAGPTAHDMFLKGAFDSDEAVFKEFVVHGGTRLFPLPFGGEPDEHCSFWIEIRGCLFQEINGKYKNKLAQMLYTRFDFFVRPHQGLPPHLVVPEDELPVAKKYARKDPGSPRVGTAVEEF